MNPTAQDPQTPPPPVDRSSHRLVLEEPERTRNWKRTTAKLLGWLLLVGVTAGVTGGLGIYYVYSDGLPEIPKVDEYFPPVLTEVYTDDAVLAGEFYNERRKVVPYERIPKRLVQAFIASEDSSFFDHFGVDVFGTARAAFKTIVKKTTGKGSVQGGSTLTQQTAKAVLISAEGYKSATAKNLTRKIREAILAIRLEKALTKEEILYLYLNNVYLGHHSYGVQSAAENYFRKDVRDLTLAEMTLIAGLPQAPSRYSPFVRPEAAKKRRTYVLGRMRAEGMITQAEHDEAQDTEVSVYPVEDVFHQFAPFFVEHVRKDVVERYGNPTLLNGGLKIFTTMDSERQRSSQVAMLDGLLEVDKRQGYRGPLQQLKKPEERQAFLEKSQKVMGEEKLTPGRFYVGLVTAIAGDEQSAQVQVGDQKGLLPLLGMRWARKLNPEGYYPALMLTSVKRAVALGDVILVRAVAEKKHLYDDKEQFDSKLEKAIPDGVTLFRLEQEPELQGALVSIDPHRQYLVAMIGGYDYDANEFNRAFQACRQPGSAFKPLVYGAAIEQLKWTQATVIVDSPIVQHDPDNQKVWKPENFGEDFQGDVLLRQAMVNSMNIPAVKTFGAVGTKNMSAWSLKMGLTTPMNMDFSAALGSSCVYPADLASVYATFDRLGDKRATYFLRKIEDRFGRTVEDHTAFDDAWAPLVDRLAGGYAALAEPSEQVMERENAFILRDLLRGVVKEGTGGPANRLGKAAAGKTGTTNDSFDTWFAGFTKDLVAVVWLGYDLNPHPLGRFETGGRASLPIWLQYMKEALGDRPQGEFHPPSALEVLKVKVDPKTGRLAAADNRNAVEMWFRKDTEPTDMETSRNQVDPNDFLMNAPN
ncbi:MAG: PBP1A family penicillin-binding protein [Myxococcota bacterium]|nr:PBP1A family penicillin-binding protein [Myxococcota bacterium]